MAHNANEKLIKNLEDQLGRLVDQLKDLEDCKGDLPEDEYQSMKDDTVEQLKEFTVTLDRMNKGDVTLTNTFSTMRAAIRMAIASSFNTVEMIQMFGDQGTSDLAQKLCALEESFQLKKISNKEYQSSKAGLLFQLNKQGHCLSKEDKAFLESRSNTEIMNGMEKIDDEDLEGNE